MQSTIVWNDEYYLPVELYKRNNCLLLVFRTNPKGKSSINILQMKTSVRTGNLECQLNSKLLFHAMIRPIISTK